MKPDMFSEALLLVVGTAILMVLVSTLCLAVFRSWNTRRPLYIYRYDL